MRKARLKKFAKLLHANQAELKYSLNRRAEATIQESPEELECVQSSAERELAFRRLELQGELLEKVQAAIERIENGTFGICLVCGRAIGEERLTAIPWARFCIGCQESVERKESRRTVLERAHLAA